MLAEEIEQYFQDEPFRILEPIIEGLMAFAMFFMDQYFGVCRAEDAQNTFYTLTPPPPIPLSGPVSLCISLSVCLSVSVSLSLSVCGVRTHAHTQVFFLWILLFWGRPAGIDIQSLYFIFCPFLSPQSLTLCRTRRASFSL